MNFSSLARELEQVLEADRLFLLAHWDADGLCSAAIFAHLLRELDKPFLIRLTGEMGEKEIDSIERSKCGACICLDLGSGRWELKELAEVAKQMKVVIIDHHQIERPPSNLLVINPRIYGLNGQRQLCSSVLAYLLAREIVKRCERDADLAIAGAIGDMQEEKGELIGLNKEVERIGIELGVVKVEKGLRIYGKNRPVYKALEQCYEPFIQGISGNEVACINLLASCGIRIKDDEGKPRKLGDLSYEEQRKIVSALVGKCDPSLLIGDIYFLSRFSLAANELSALLNACGKEGYGGIGVAAALGDMGARKLAEGIESEYRSKLFEAIKWYEGNEGKMKQSERCLYLIGGKDICESVLSSLCSILIHSIEKEVLVGFANAKEHVKVSVRSKGKVDVGKAVARAVEGWGRGGGHELSAGASIPLGTEELFMSRFEQAL